jgi:hypothetical protein
MVFKLHLPISIALSAVIMTACTHDSMSNLVIPEQTDDGCRLESGLHVLDNDRGIQFTNICKSCLVAVFEFRQENSDAFRPAACYVPAETRVFFVQADQYRMTREFHCDTLEKMNSDSAIKIKTELMNNYRNRRCDIFASFAD